MAAKHLTATPGPWDHLYQGPKKCQKKSSPYSGARKKRRKTLFFFRNNLVANLESFWARPVRCNPTSFSTYEEPEVCFGPLANLDSFFCAGRGSKRREDKRPLLSSGCASCRSSTVPNPSGPIHPCYRTRVLRIHVPSTCVRVFFASFFPPSAPFFSGKTALVEGSDSHFL